MSASWRNAHAAYAATSRAWGRRFETCLGRLVQPQLAAPFFEIWACVQLRNPALPPFIGELLLDGIAVADSHLDLRLSRSGDDVITVVDRRAGAANLVIVK